MSCAFPRYIRAAGVDTLVWKMGIYSGKSWVGLWARHRFKGCGWRQVKRRNKTIAPLLHHRAAIRQLHGEYPRSFRTVGRWVRRQAATIGTAAHSTSSAFEAAQVATAASPAAQATNSLRKWKRSPPPTKQGKATISRQRSPPPRKLGSAGDDHFLPEKVDGRQPVDRRRPDHHFLDHHGPGHPHHHTRRLRHLGRRPHLAAWDR